MGFKDYKDYGHWWTIKIIHIFISLNILLKIITGNIKKFLPWYLLSNTLGNQYHKAFGIRYICIWNTFIKNILSKSGNEYY